MKLKSTISYITISIIFGAIIISFAFTGFVAGPSNNAVAIVGSEEVEFAEYSRAYNSQIQRFSQLFGGKNLTAAQIRQFRLKENTLNSLVQQKLALELAGKINLDTAIADVKNDIKQAPYFQTNGQFDVNKYRSLLRANGFTPTRFEEESRKNLKLKKIETLFNSVIPSEELLKKAYALKEEKVSINFIAFNKENLVKYISISQSELNKFADDTKNEAILKSLYGSMKAQFNKPEEIFARHILIKEDPKNKGAALKKAKALRSKLTAKNFAKMASKSTQDPSGKGKAQGSLGWFSRGKMVPAFDKAAFALKKGEISSPVVTNFGVHLILVEKKKAAVTKTFAQVKKIVAKSHLQKTNRDKLNKLYKNILTQSQEFLAKGQIKKAQTFLSQYALNLEKKIEVGPLSKGHNSYELSLDNILKMVYKKDKKVFVEEKNSQAMVYALSGASIKKENKFDDKFATRNFASQVRKETMEQIEKDTDIKTFPNRL